MQKFITFQTQASARGRGGPGNICTHLLVVWVGAQLPGTTSKVPCHAMPCHAVPCYAVPCHASPAQPLSPFHIESSTELHLLILQHRGGGSAVLSPPKPSVVMDRIMGCQVLVMGKEGRKGKGGDPPHFLLSPFAAADILMPRPRKALIQPNGIKIFAPALYLHNDCWELGLSPQPVH